MLTKPVYGWSTFQLEDTFEYSLSYLDDIAFEWLEQAIHGLETMLPFCVKGFMEPERFLCLVSYWNCHIISENESRYPLDNSDVAHEFSHTSMLQFCQYLYDDISQNIDEWALFVDYQKIDVSARKKELLEKLAYLKELIAQREERFGENRCFL